MEYKHKVVKDTTDVTEIEVTVPFKELEPYREAAYKDLSKDIKIQGFRPGKAPRHLIEPKIASELVNESVGRLLQTAAFKVMADEDYRPILQPEFNLTSMDPEKGIIFTFTFTNYPKVDLGDFSKIKVAKEDIEISDEEVDTVIKSIIRSNIASERLKELTKVIESKGNKKDSKKKTEDNKGTVEDFELNDALIEELGYEKEKTLEKVREQVREQLTSMKERQVEDEYVNQIVEKAVALSKFEIPKIMLDNEISAAEQSFTKRLEELNLDEDTYLATQGRKKKDLEKEWKEAAEKRVGVDLILVNITMKNEAMPSDEDVETEISLISDPAEKKRFDSRNGRDYIRMVLARRKGVELLKEQVGSPKKKSAKKKSTNKKKESKSKK